MNRYIVTIKRNGKSTRPIVKIYNCINSPEELFYNELLVKLLKRGYRFDNNGLKRLDEMKLLAILDQTISFGQKHYEIEDIRSNPFLVEKKLTLKEYGKPDTIRVFFTVEIETVYN